MAVDYWRNCAQVAFNRQIQLDEQLTQARCRAGRVSAENVAIAQAAQALLSAIRDDDEALRPLAANLCTALASGYTQSMAAAASNAVPIYAATEVIRRMLAKMKTGDKLERAAERWAVVGCQHSTVKVDSAPP